MHPANPVRPRLSNAIRARLSAAKKAEISRTKLIAVITLVIAATRDRGSLPALPSENRTSTKTNKARRVLLAIAAQKLRIKTTENHNARPAAVQSSAAEMIPTALSAVVGLRSRFQLSLIAMAR
jgi:hypothetical protein